MITPETRFCRECGDRFFVKRKDQDFCTGTCRKVFHSRRQGCGMELYDLVIKWRGERPKGGFTQLTQLADRYLADERARLKAREKRIAEQKKMATA